MTDVESVCDEARVGLACEGRRDLAYLKGLLDEASSDSAFPARFIVSELRPNSVVGQGGWTRLRKWAKKTGRATLVARQLDLVIVLVDGDVARQPELAEVLDANQRLPDRNEDLCDQVKGWIQPPKDTKRLLIVIPTDELETWLLSAAGQAVTEEELDTKERLLEEVHGSTYDDTYYGLMGRASWRDREKLTKSLPEFERFLKKLDQWLECWTTGGL